MKVYPWICLPVAAISTPAYMSAAVPAYAATYLTVEQAQMAIFPGASFAATGQPGVWRTPAGDRFIVDKVVGKHEYITFAVGIGTNGAVKQIEIMEYNESYGYDVRNADWRAQFIGKTASSPLQLNADIKNISGATLSSKHVTDGVKRILQKYGRG